MAAPTWPLTQLIAQPTCLMTPLHCCHSSLNYQKTKSDKRQHAAFVEGIAAYVGFVRWAVQLADCLPDGNGEDAVHQVGDSPILLQRGCEEPDRGSNNGMLLVSRFLNL